jgi:endonuclease/exonuclease/phosphatase family metal-dependent hydrolase
VVIATLAKNGVPFAAASIHLGLDAAQRERHLADVLDLVDGLVDRLDHGPIVIAGDINESSEGPAWAALASVYTDVGAGDNTATFSVRNPRHRIDGIFVRGLTVESYHVVNSPDVQKASDHRPIMAELGLVAG